MVMEAGDNSGRKLVVHLFYIVAQQWLSPIARGSSPWQRMSIVPNPAWSRWLLG